MKIKIKKEIEKPYEQGEEDNFPLSEISYKPTKDFLDSIWGNITRHGIKIMADGRQWVLHCITGEVLAREECEPFKNKQGSVMWKRKGEEISVLDQLKYFAWKNPEQGRTNV